MHSYFQQLRLSDTIPVKPAIHIYFNQYGSPLEMVNNGNHFAYLEFISTPTNKTVNNVLLRSNKPNIITQESGVIEFVM